MADFRLSVNEVARSYDAVADEYASRIAGELAHKPFDREILDHFAASVRRRGVVGEIGCGPGHVARYLAGNGVRACGADLSFGMLRVARGLHPGTSFLQCDMRHLPVGDRTWSGIVAFYSLIHLAPAEVPAALREYARVLEPGGRVLLAFHIGSEMVHLDEWWEKPVSVDFHFFRSESMCEWLQDAGFRVDAVRERDPYAEAVEHQSRRAYITATAPEADSASHAPGTTMRPFGI